MPSQNKTKTLQLSQWQGHEYVSFDDISEDNRKIDTAVEQINTNLSNKIDRSEVQGLIGNVDLSGKVDKVAGKGLSTNDYTTAEKNKVANLPTNTNMELNNIRSSISSISFTASNASAGLSNKVDKVTGKGLSTNDYTTVDRNKVNNLPANTNQEIANLKNSVVNGKNAIATAINDLALENVANSSMTHNDLGVVIRNNLNVPYVFFKNGKFNKKNINPITRVVSYRNGLSDYYNESQKGSYIDINNYTIRLNGVSGAYGGILISPQMIDFSGYHFIGISTSQGYGRLRVGSLNALPPVIKGSLINKPSATQSFYIDIIDGSVKLSTGRFLNSPRGYFFIECENWQGGYLTISEIYFFRA